jgi:ribosomal protein L1
MADEIKFEKALETLRKSEKKVNFNQTLDLLINLKNFDVRREAFNTFISVPHKIKERKIAGFLEKKSNLVFTITKDEFTRFKDKKEIKNIAVKQDFFIASAKLMPAIATTFGRALGPLGKMPSPQLGVISDEDEKTIKNICDKINKSVRIRVKEPSIKIAVATQNMKDKEIIENILSVYNKLLDILPKKNENIKSVLIKFTMDKPVKVE